MGAMSAWPRSGRLRSAVAATVWAAAVLGRLA
jgi:hypothetical protein